MAREFPVGTIRNWQKGTVIKAHDPMPPISSGWILLRNSPELEVIGADCDRMAEEIKDYDIPINGEKFLDHEINSFEDDDGNKLFRSDDFKQYYGFTGSGIYRAGYYSFRNEFSKKFMLNDMTLKKEISQALISANLRKGGDRRNNLLTNEERREIRREVEENFNEDYNPFNVEVAKQLRDIVKRTHEQLKEGFEFKDPEKKLIYENFISIADSLPVEYDRIREKRKLKDDQISIIEEVFDNNWGVRETLRDYIEGKFKEYVRKFADEISKDALDDQIERFGVTVDMDPDEFYSRIYDKIDEELDSDDGSFGDLIYLRFTKLYGKSVSGDWSLRHLPALHNLEKAILELPKGHFLLNDWVEGITNESYNGGDHGGYAWYSSRDRRINFSADSVERGSVFGILANEEEFKSTMYHEIGHSVSKKLDRENFYNYRKFAVQCGWTYQSKELRAGMTATGDDRDIPRTGSNANITLISGYAAKSPEEAFAEYYSFYAVNKDTFDQFFETLDERKLKTKTFHQIDSKEGIQVSDSQLGYLAGSFRNREDFGNQMRKIESIQNNLSGMEVDIDLELVSPWDTRMSQEEGSKYEPKKLKRRKDLDPSRMPPIISYSKGDRRIVVDGITRVEQARMNKHGVPSITLSNEFYHRMKDSGLSDSDIREYCYYKMEHKNIPYQSKAAVKLFGMTHRNTFVPFSTLKENLSALKVMRDIFHSKELEKAMRELFQKSIDGSPDVNELAELHGVSVSNIVEQLTLGVMVEKEKIGDKNRAKQVALTNLIEFPDYYTKLEAFPKRKDIEIKKSGKGALYLFTDSIKKALKNFNIGEISKELILNIEIKKSTLNELSDSVENFLTSEGIRVYNKSRGLDQLNKSIFLRVGDPINGIHIGIFEKDLGVDDPLYLNINMDDSEIGKRLLESIGTITLKYPELEKARHGVYQDNPENRRLKRVGKKYGTKGEEKPTSQKKQGKTEESKISTKDFTDEDLSDFARQSSEEELNVASTGKDERLRLAAKIELARRKDEEEIVVVREDELNDDGSIKGDEKEDSEKDIKPKEDERKDKGNRDKE